MKRIRPIELLPAQTVQVHLMAEQEFCELKVDLELRHRDIEQRKRELPETLDAAEAATARRSLEALDSGKALHQAVAAAARPISPDDVPPLVASRRPFTVIESLFGGRYGTLPLVGKPDAVHFDGQGRAWVIDYKARPRPFVTPSDHVQLRLYGYLLRQHARRFPVKQMALVCVLADRAAVTRIKALPEDRLVGLARLVCTDPPAAHGPRQRWEQHRVRGLSPSVLHAVTFNYDPNKMRSELTFLSGYWLGKREPKRTTKPWKCAVCVVNRERLCPVAIVRYGTRMPRS